MIYTLYASHCSLGLSQDGAVYFLQMIETKGFVLLEPGRIASHLLQQWVVVALLRLGVNQLPTLVYAYTLCMIATPTLFVILTYVVLPPGRKGAFLLPLLSYLLESGLYFPIGEAMIASTYFWLIMICVSYFPYTITRGVIIAVISMPAPWMHEAMIFLLPILSLAAADRARCASTSAERVFFICLSFAYLASVAIPLTGFFQPVKDFERARFFRNTFRFRFLVWDNQWNVPLLVGVVAIALISCNAWLTLRAKGAAALRHRAWLPVALTGIGVMVVAATVASDRLIGVNPIKEARNVGAFASAGFGCLYLLFGRREQFHRLALDPCMVGLIGALTLVQFGWYSVATTRWAEYVRDLQYIVTTCRGYVPFDAALGVLPNRHANLFSRMSGWTNPALSVLLAPTRVVMAIVGSSPGRVAPMEVFDPHRRESLPGSTLLDYAPYQAALGSQATQGPSACSRSGS